MLNIYDKNGKRLGYNKQGQINYCFNDGGKQIGKIAQNGNDVYLYDYNNNLIARYNGANTYNKNSNLIGRGNLLYDKLVLFKKAYDILSVNDKKFNKCGVIFCNINGTPRFPHYLNHLLAKHLIEAGCKKITCHKMRHTWITRIISKGAKINMASKLKEPQVLHPQIIVNILHN